VPRVPTVLPPTQLTALRTRDRRPTRFDHEDQTAITLDDDQAMHQRAGTAPSGATILTLLESHANAISGRLEEA
jgi:hypothetical protein